MADPLRNISTTSTPQSQPVPGSSQVPNSAGGYTFQLDDWKQLERFLILGTEGGTYYIKEQKLTADNATLLLRCIQQDGQTVVKMVVELDKDNRAPKMNPLLFALAATLTVGDLSSRRAAERAVQTVCRTGYHLYLLATYVKQFKNIGGGKVTKRAFSTWFTVKSEHDLAYQFIKYRQREGWTMRDVLNLSRPTPVSATQSAIFKWAIDTAYGNEVTVPNEPLISAFTEVQSTDSERRVIELIIAHNLPWEALPDRWMNNATVWEALVSATIGYTALMRQLPRLTNLGVVKDLSSTTDRVATLLTNGEKIKAAHVHPLSILLALKQYSTGHGDRGKQTWTPVRAVVDALDAGFYEAFNFVESTGKRHYIAVDVSGSMDYGTIAGTSITPREGAAAMAMSIARSEKNWCLYGFSTHLVDVGISTADRLHTVLSKMEQIPMGGTDCAQPMLDAQRRGLDVDVFVTFTDNETWAGEIHPFQALKNYRNTSGIDSKSVICGMTSTGFSIADPRDLGMLDVVGMDASVPALIASFARG